MGEVKKPTCFTQEELDALRWKDIDLENGTIDINHTLAMSRHTRTV